MFNWEAIGAIGEILGALAVVASLVYVANQTKANSKALRSNASAQQMGTFIEIVKTGFENPEVAEFMTKLRNTASLAELTDIEMTRATAYFAMSLKALENNYLEWRSGNLPEAEWEAVDNSVSGFFLQIPIMEEIWTGGAGAGFTQEFREYTTKKFSDLAEEELSAALFSAKPKGA